MSTKEEDFTRVMQDAVKRLNNLKRRREYDADLQKCEEYIESATRATLIVQRTYRK